MSISGPNASPFRLPGLAPGTTYVRPTAPRSAPASNAPAAAPSEAASAATNETGLWELLTAEEKEFFQQAATLGSITYRPSRASAAPLPAAPVGQRLDVRG